MNRNSFQSNGVNLSQVTMNTQNINNLTRAITKLRNEISTSFIKLSDTPSFFGAAGQVVAVNSTRTGLEFVNQTTGGGGGGGGGSTTLSGLTDTDVTSSADNHLLQYNGTTQNWENITDLTLPGTLTCPNAASFGAISGSVLSLSGQAFFMNNRHEILADVKFRGDTYIQQQGSNPAIGFYCNTQTNPPRVGIGTTDQDDTLTVKGGFGIRSGTAVNNVVPLLTANSAFNRIVTNGEMSDADGSYLVTFNNNVSIKEDLKLVGRLQLGGGADAGDINYIVASTGPTTAPRWVDHRQQIASFVLANNVINTTAPKQVLPWTTGPGGNFWEEKASTIQGAVPVYLSNQIYHSANLTYNHVQLVGNNTNGSLIQLSQVGKYRITLRVTFEVRAGSNTGQKQNLELIILLYQFLQPKYHI